MAITVLLLLLLFQQTTSVGFLHTPMFSLSSLLIQSVLNSPTNLMRLFKYFFMLCLYFYITFIKLDILSETCFIYFLLKFVILVRSKRLSGIVKKIPFQD